MRLMMINHLNHSQVSNLRLSVKVWVKGFFVCWRKTIIFEAVRSNIVSIPWLKGYTGHEPRATTVYFDLMEDQKDRLSMNLLVYSLVNQELREKITLQVITLHNSVTLVSPSERVVLGLLASFCLYSFQNLVFIHI